MGILKKFVICSYPLALMVALICLAVSRGHASGPTGSQSPRIVIRGSSTLLPVVKIWVNEYRRTTTATDIDIKATGSSEGIEDLLAGRADIAMASRPITETEISTAKRGGLVFRETVVARMGIAVVINRDNPVSSVMVDKLAEVFSGEIRNWKEIGGPDEMITVVRKTSGWSPEFFRRRIMGDSEYASESLIVDSKEEIVDEVGKRIWSIGVTGMPDALPALDQIRLMRLTGKTSEEDSTYALSRPLYFYTTGDSPTLQSFTEYVLSSEAQDLIVETGLYPARQTDTMESD